MDACLGAWGTGGREVEGGTGGSGSEVLWNGVPQSPFATAIQSASQKNSYVSKLTTCFFASLSVPLIGYSRV